jgi:hypothetical protein
MKVTVKMLNDDNDIVMDLEGDNYRIKDTLSEWTIIDSRDNVIAIFNKFETISIALQNTEPEKMYCNFEATEDGTVVRFNGYTEVGSKEYQDMVDNGWKPIEFISYSDLKKYK